MKPRVVKDGHRDGSPWWPAAECQQETGGRPDPADVHVEGLTAAAGPVGRCTARNETRR